MFQSIDIHKIKSYTQTNKQQSISIVEVEDEISASCELIKILHKHNQMSGWTLLLAPDLIPSKSFLDSCSIDTSKLLVIRQKHLTNLEYVINSAMNNGNFSAVIAYTDIVSPLFLSEIIDANKQKQTALYCFSNTGANN